jgi:hypothetical protein
LRFPTALERAAYDNGGYNNRQLFFACIMIKEASTEQLPVC